MLIAKTGHVRIKDVGCYPNLVKALGCIVACRIEEQLKGIYLYHVEARSFKTMGCNVGDDKEDFPFYSSEVEVISEG